MIKSYIKSIGDLDSTSYDKTEGVSIYSEISGQYFCTTYNHSTGNFGTFLIQAGEYRVGQAVKHFKMSWQPELLRKTIKQYKKRKYFRGSDIIKFYFKYNGHRLELVDVWNEKEGYIGPKDYNEFFCIPYYIESSKLLGQRKLNKKFIESNKGLLCRLNNGIKIKL